MVYFLRRTRDGAGDSGSMSNIGRLVDGKEEWEHNAEPRVGWVIRVGSSFSRTFSYTDYWTTTPVTEILSREEDKDGRVTVEFRTGNSEYVWRS